MWDAFVANFNGGIEIGKLFSSRSRQDVFELTTRRSHLDYEKSYYIGDAAGRSNDHADTDRSEFVSLPPRSLANLTLPA